MSTHVRVQDLCRGGGRGDFADIAQELRWQQKFGPQNWGPGGGRPSSLDQNLQAEYLIDLDLHLYAMLENHITSSKGN